MAPWKKTYIVREQRQLAALASPVRQEIVDVLSQMGTVSVAEIAAALGRPADALYYHLRALKKSGLVLNAGYRPAGNRREELFRTIAPDLKLHYDLGNKQNAQAISAIVSSMLRLGTRDFRRAFASGDAAVSGERRELWAVRRTGWLLPQELIAMNASIERLRKPILKPRKGGRLYAITVLFTPLTDRVRKKASD